MIGFYNPGRRSKKWRKRVFFHILECCIYILDSHVWPLEHALHGRKKQKIIHCSELTLQKCLLKHLDFDSVVDEEKQFNCRPFHFPLFSHHNI